MKLSILAAAAGFLVVPVLVHAQTDTTMKKDTAMSAMSMGDKAATKTTKMKRSTRRAKAAGAATAASSSNGTDCPRGCPTSKGAAGLTGVQFLALQQELRDQGCGNTSVTGVYDGATRRAVAACAKKLNVANKPGAVLVAFNIGFGESDIGTSPPKTE